MLNTVSVILINYNGIRFLENCLSSVQNQTYKPLEIIIIDNASKDGSLELAQQKYANIKVVSNDENIGFAQAANQGIKCAKGSYILLLNVDVELDKDFIKEALTSMNIDNRIGIVSGKILNMENRKYIDSAGQFLSKELRPKERNYRKPDKLSFYGGDYVFSVCAAVGMYRKEMLEDIKIYNEYFDEDFFMFSEDLDLGYRAQLFGWKSYYNENAVAYHYRGGSAVEKQKSHFNNQFVKKSLFLQKHIIINRYLLLIKNTSLSTVFSQLFWIILFEIKMWGYICVFSPSLLLLPFKNIRLFISAFKKRKIIQGHRVVSESYIRKWII